MVKVAIVAASLVHARIDNASSVIHKQTNIKSLSSLPVARVVLKDRRELSAMNPNINST